MKRYLFLFISFFFYSYIYSQVTNDTVRTLEQDTSVVFKTEMDEMFIGKDEAKLEEMERIKKIPNLKERFEKLILVQNWIFSYLSINPTELDSFYHLAGITHRLAMDLLKTRDRVFENQEAWILNFHPLLSTLIRYAKDFSASETRVQSMEALLEDFLLKQSKLSR